MEDNFKGVYAQYLNMPDVVVTHSHAYMTAIGITTPEKMVPVAYRVRPNGIHELKVRLKSSSVDDGSWFSMEWLQVLDYGRSEHNFEWFRSRHIGKCHPDHVEFKRKEKKEALRA